MSLSVEVLKDGFGQEIVEGHLCIVHKDRFGGFMIGYIAETRKKVKVVYMGRVWNGKAQGWREEPVEAWFDVGEVLMFNEENLFALMNAELLHSMATLREECRPIAEKITQRKEAKRLREAKKKSEE